MIKHDGHFITHMKYRNTNCRPVFSTFLEFRLLHLIYDIDVTRRKRIKHAFSVLHSDKTWVFDQSERALTVKIQHGTNFAVVMIESPISLLLITFEQT